MTCGLGPLAAQPASADGFVGVTTPSADYWFCAHSSIATAWDQQVVQAGMTYLDSRTDIYQIPEVCRTTTDTMFLYNNNLVDVYGNPLRGLTFPINCVYSLCQFWVAVNPNLISLQAGGSPSSYEYNLNKTMRHEIGHTVGLEHGSGQSNHVPCATTLNDSMVVGPVNPGSGWLYYQYWSYNDHHKCQIDALY